MKKIKLDFDDGHSLELNEHNETTQRGKEEIKSGLFYDDMTYNCRGEIRELYCSAYLGVDREILDYLPSNKWSLVGRILQEVNKKFLEENYTSNGKTQKKEKWLKEWLKIVRDKLLFSVKDESGQNIMEKFTGILQEECAKQLNRPKTDLQIDLSLYDPWNFYKTLQLIVREHDLDIEFQASNLGMGVQAAISIAILKAYSELNLDNKSPIFIDEPELFLHPQAQRNFYKILREISETKYDSDGNISREGTQVFYTTHSPNFLSTGSFNEIFLIRKNGEAGTYIKYADIGDFIEDFRIRIGVKTNYEDLMLHYRNAYENTGDTQKANEGFFANKIILVEGQSESLILPLFFEKKGFDHIKEGISIVRCGGKNEIDRFYRLYTEFGIPVYVIFDGDFHLDKGSEKEGNVSMNRRILSLFESGKISDYPNNIVNERYFGFKDKFENNLGFSSSEKGLKLYITVKEQLKKEASGVPDWVNDVIENISALPEYTTETVLRKKSA